MLCALCPLLANAQTSQESSCIACHKLLDGELLAPVTAMASDIHAQNGFGCESCHGGNPSPAVAEDPEAAMSRAAGARIVAEASTARSRTLTVASRVGCPRPVLTLAI